MWVTEFTNFKCPYCGSEYRRIVGSGNVYKYKGKHYEDEYCRKCNARYLYGNGEFVQIPEDTGELEYVASWIS